MILSDPWIVQISMLPVRRYYADEERDARRRAGGMPPNLRKAVKLAKDIQQKNRQIIFDALGSSCVTATRLQQKTGISDDTVRKHLAALAKEGLVRQIKPWGPWKKC